MTLLAEFPETDLLKVALEGLGEHQEAPRAPSSPVAAVEVCPPADLAETLSMTEPAARSRRNHRRSIRNEDELLRRTITSWQPRSPRTLQHSDARKIVSNLTEFVTLLARWNDGAARRAGALA
ncbi:MAG: hypothetical protein D6731_16300 [Planctomycetota bacterium]|nr:MAG: hypothetical protein D6731_16300 [Planctomycetota bacterium]